MKDFIVSSLGQKQAISADGFDVIRNHEDYRDLVLQTNGRLIAVFREWDSVVECERVGAVMP